MCNHQEREKAMVVLSETVWCDPCLVTLVSALNAGGVPTLASCCGHGTNFATVALQNGDWLVVVPHDEWDTFSTRRSGSVLDIESVTR